MTQLSVARDYLDSELVGSWLRTALVNLRRHRATINALNVFPVADRDTGSNLVHTLTGAVAAIDPGDQQSGSGPTAVLAAVASGAALSAHGNSGIIVAELLRGMAGCLAAEPDASTPGAAELTRALRAGHGAALASVGEPTEGTILTVLNAAAEAAERYHLQTPDCTLLGVALSAVAAGRTALAATPGQLAVLREAGVVDAGAAGLVVLLEALVAAIDPSRPELSGLDEFAALPPDGIDEHGLAGARYEVQFVLVSDSAGAVAGLRDRLELLGDSITIAQVAEAQYAVHVHVGEPGATIEAALEAGLPSRIRISVLPADKPTAVAADIPDGPVAIVAIAGAPGVADLFRSERVTVLEAWSGVVPTVPELVRCLIETGVERTVLLPNSADLAGLAEQAAALAREQGVGVAVVPTRSPVQGLAAVAVHDPHRRYDDDVIAMAEAAAATRVGEVMIAEQESITYAGRCEAGDVLGLIDGEVVEIGSDYGRVGIALVRRLVAAGGELVTVLPGRAGAEAAEVIHRYVRTRHPLVDVTVLDGTPADAPLLIGVE